MNIFVKSSVTNYLFIYLFRIFLHDIMFHGIVRKAFHGPKRRRLCCGKIYLGGNLPLDFQFPILLCHAMEKAQAFLQQGQNKGQSPELLFHIKALFSGAHTVCVGLYGC